MILRAFAILIGLGLLAATAHVTIEQAGGYGTPSSFITIAVAAGVGIGAVTIGVAWGERRRWIAVAILIALLCGEAWGLISTGERIVSVRDAAQAPLREAAARHQTALAAFRAAEIATPTPADQSRLKSAQKHWENAETAVRESAAKKECRENCRRLLQAAVDAATVEVGAAREEVAEHDRKEAQKIATRIAAARTKLTENPMPGSVSPLADRLGLPSWALDLLTAALGAIAANGLAAGLLAFAVHRKPSAPVPQPLASHPLVIDRPQIAPPTEYSPAPVSSVEIAPAPVATVAPADTTEIDAVPAPSRAVGKRTPRKTSAALSLEHVKAFAADRLFPDPEGRLRLAAAHGAYVEWCRQSERAPVDPGDFADAFARIVKQLALPVRHTAAGPVILGASIGSAQVEHQAA